MRKQSPYAKTRKKKNASQAETFHVPRGMNDILPAMQASWQRLRKKTEELAAFYHFNRIETPLLESAELFASGFGEDSRREKEFYYVKGGATLALRRDETIPILRAYLEHALGRQAQPQRLYAEGPVFCRDRASHYRQCTRAGFHVIGGLNDPLYDSQVILVFHHFLRDLRIPKVILKVNSLGCRVCRPFYRRQLSAYYSRAVKRICEDCASDLKENPLRLLSCARPECAELTADAPNVLDKICVSCSHHLQRVLEYLDELKIPYGLESRLVGAFDYYHRTIFAFSSVEYGHGPLAAGGRYDYLMEAIGGRVTPAVGGALTYEYLLNTPQSEEERREPKHGRRVFVIHVGDLAKRKAVRLAEDLRGSGMVVGEVLGKESLHAQLKAAEKEGYRVALIVGQREMYEESVIMRNLATSIQETVPLARIAEEVRKHFKKP